MNMREIRTTNDYFKHLDTEILSKIEKMYPKLTMYYDDLKKEFQEVCEGRATDMILDIKKLLSLDAQIQILRGYASDDALLHTHVGNETLLIKLIKNDSKCYYREKTGLSYLDEIPMGILYLSENMSRKSYIEGDKRPFK